MLYLTVNLFGKNGIRGEFREYEAKALALFRKHGGEVVVAFAPASRAESEETPDEIQVLRISDQSKFEAFMNDPDRLEMAEERISVIRKTEVFLSEEVVEY